jgi:hypothetical protein
MQVDIGVAEQGISFFIVSKLQKGRVLYCDTDLVRVETT